MKKQLLLSLSFLMITAFTLIRAQTGSITIVSIQSPIEVGATGTITLTYTSTVPCFLNTQLRETNANLNTVNWSPWHGEQNVTGLPIASVPTTVTFNYSISGTEVTSASLSTSKPGVQFTFAFNLKPTAGGGGFAFKDGTAANLVTLNPSSVVTNSVNITSVASTISAGSDLQVNFNYTLANAGKVKVEVRKFNGTTYISGAAGLVIESLIDPAAATSTTPVTGTKTLTIPLVTPLSASLSGAENYKVVVTIYNSSWGYISDKKSDLTITTSITTWNGSAWSAGVPDLNKEVVIANAYSTSGNLTAKKLTVNTGASFTIVSGDNVTVTNEVVNNAGANGIVIQNNANLIQTNNVANTGAITVNRASASLLRQDYTMWSSPTGTTQKLNEFSPDTYTGRFYEYNSTLDKYSLVADAAPFVTGKGFLIRMPNTWSDATASSWTGSFTGIPNNGTISITGLTAAGYNAIGNPYPSTISADNFITDNSIVEAIYFWRKTNNAGGTAYATYTKVGAVGNPGNGGITPNGTIQVGQGFIIKAPATSVLFTNTMRASSNSTQFLKIKQVNKNRVWINLSQGTEPVNQILVAYMDGATTGIDAAIDGKYINDSATALTSNIDGGEYVIQGRPAFDASDVVALNFKSENAGTYTIAIDHVDGLFATGQEVYLMDANTGVETNLQKDAYTFTAVVGNDNARFSLKYQKTLGVNAAAFNDNSVKVYRNNGILNVTSGSNAISSIKVFDIQGRVLTEQNKINALTATIKNLRTDNQVVFVQVTSDDNSVVTKKVVH